MGKEKSLKKVELTEEDFLFIMDIKRIMESTMRHLMDKMDEILERHIVRDPSWKGQIVPFEKKKLVIKLPEERGKTN